MPSMRFMVISKTNKKSPTFGYVRRRECANEHRFTTKEVFIPQEAIDEERRNHLEDMRERLESIRARRRKTTRKDT
jgi:quinol monooxygenase YgiN